MFLVLLLFCSVWQAADAQAIPESVKNKVKMWVYGKASDEDFVELVKQLDRYGLSVPKFEHVDTYILPSYDNTVFAKISGRTTDYTGTSSVVIISDPDGQRTEYTVSVLQGGAYFTLFPLSFSSTPGLYTLTLSQLKQGDSCPPDVH